MTKNKEIYNVSFSGSPIYQSNTTNMKTQEEDLFTQAVKQQHEAVLFSEKQYLDKTFKPDSIVESVRQEMLDRAKRGQQKYKTTLDRTDLSIIDYLQHAKEEALDLALYLEKTIQMLKGKSNG